MQDSVNDNFIGFDFKEHTIITDAQSISGLKLGEPLNVTVQVVARQSEFLDDSLLIASLKISEIFFRARLEADFVFHWGETRLSPAGADVRGQSGTESPLKK